MASLPGRCGHPPPASGASTCSGWQFSGSQPLDEAYVPFFGAFGAAWDDLMVARWSANPFGMLWSEMDAAFVKRRGEGGGPVAVSRPVVIIAAG
jgi:hypothetical protein